MNESYDEEFAIHFSLQRRGGCGNNVVSSARAEGQAGKLDFNREIPSASQLTFGWERSATPSSGLTRKN